MGKSYGAFLAVLGGGNVIFMMSNVVKRIISKRRLDAIVKQKKALIDKIQKDRARIEIEFALIMEEDGISPEEVQVHSQESSVEVGSDLEIQSTSREVQIISREVQSSSREVNQIVDTNQQKTTVIVKIKRAARPVKEAVRVMKNRKGYVRNQIQILAIVQEERLEESNITQ